MYYETIDIVGKRAEKRESEKEVLRDGAYVIDCVQSESVYVRTFDMGDWSARLYPHKKMNLEFEIRAIFRSCCYSSLGNMTRGYTNKESLETRISAVFEKSARHL